MPVKIFCCYAHEDERLLKKLKIHLRPLQRQSLIDIWHDRDISAGEEWEREISKHLNEAQIILLLVSPDFINSDYCYSIEMKQALERHQRGEAHVIPIILRNVYWHKAPFGELQALPTDAKAVTSRYWRNLDEAFFNVAEGIHRTIRDTISQTDTTTTESFQAPAQTSTYSISLLTKEQWLEEGKNLYELKRFHDALVAWEQAIRLDPNYAPAYKDRGGSLFCLKRYEEALEDFEQAMKLDSKYTHLYTEALEILRKPTPQFKEEIPTYEPGDNRFDKFTKQASMAISRAQKEVQRLHHNYLGTEHLLLGLTLVHESAAVEILSEFDVYYDKVRSAVEFLIAPGDGTVLSELGLTPRAKKVIELSVSEARSFNHNYIGTEHILLGMLREGECVGAGVLEALYVRLEDVQAQIIPGPSRSSTPHEMTVKRLKEAILELKSVQSEKKQAIQEQESERVAELRVHEIELHDNIYKLISEWLR